MSIKERLIQFIAINGYSKTKAAKAIDISNTALTLYLNGNYGASVKNVEEKIADFLRREEEKARRPVVSKDFVSTRLAAKCLNLMRNSHIDGDIGVLYGKAGIGKTIIMEHYASRSTDVLLIEADPGYTAKVLLQVLCERLKCNKRGNIHELTENCVTALKGTGWLIAIDEAELLPYRALEVLRRIYDRSGVGIVLAGMPRLLMNLKGGRGEYEQLYSRVGMALNLDEERIKTERDDFSVVLDSLLPDDCERSGALEDAFYRESKGSYRRLFKLARGVVRASRIDEQGYSPELVEEYSRMLIH
ncbi:TPA: AAA family ATPase [Klebsiella oxytoca]|uniref:AAA family ATPase n=1 Tax=Klebsiella oxytoca TaxID=571 RepID=UPI000CC6CBB2|nr:ATPase [Klebsiella michiganensis]HBM3102606.1 AAA family ATPase [Klebsiella oxytoca]HBM3103655.1 AAA family ATPase [Klebsiella oxytoca]HBM3248976.1 AAA family ATPase [Klebsiella oxytoca]HDS9081006.1 AAA family ATPase [Klebsiella oxytoca]